MGMIHKTKVRKSRSRWSHLDNAEEMIGKIEKNDTFFGITCGNVSKIDLLEHCMNQVAGKVNILIATWTVADYDMRKLKSFINSDKINSIKFIVDRSFVARQPGFCKELKNLFGEDSIKFQKIHSKLFCIIGEDKEICCFTSMNLNENKRFENFVINCDNELVKKTLDFFDVVFDNSPKDHKKCDSNMLDFFIGKNDDISFDF